MPEYYNTLESHFSRADKKKETQPKKYSLFRLSCPLWTKTRYHSDNSTTVSCINKFGTSRSQECDFIRKEIWQWASISSIWLSPTHLPGIQSTEADFESRKYEIHTEWKLNESVLHLICRELGFSPTIVLFATRINTQLRTFFSYRPDTNRAAVNAFLRNWGKKVLCIPFICMFIQNPSKNLSG